MAQTASTSYRSPASRSQGRLGTAPRIADLFQAYTIHLRAEGKATATVDHTYLPHLRAFEAFLRASGMPLAVDSIRREHVEAYIVSLQQAGKRPATVSLAFRSLSPFWRWCIDEGEIKVSPMQLMKRPKVEVESPPVLTPDQLQRLLKACDGQDFESRRDLAILSLLSDSGMRRGEIAGLDVKDIDLERMTVIVRAEHSKGRRTRTARFGAQTARALSRYLRLRPSHPYAATASLWLGRRGPTTGSGILQIVERRGKQSGVEAFVHLFRHSYAHAHLLDGGAEGDLMELAGWTDRSMLRRYGASAAGERARSNYRSPLDRMREQRRSR
jgi:site-specific recombinase XerD